MKTTIKNDEKKNLAELLSEVLNHPDTPASVYNDLSDTLCSFSLPRDFVDSPEYIAMLLSNAEPPPIENGHDESVFQREKPISDSTSEKSAVHAEPPIDPAVVERLEELREEALKLQDRQQELFQEAVYLTSEEDSNNCTWDFLMNNDYRDANELLQSLATRKAASV